MTPNELRETLKALGLTQQAAADLLHVQQSTIYRWLAGIHPIDANAADRLRDKLAAKERD